MRTIKSKNLGQKNRKVREVKNNYSMWEDEQHQRSGSSVGVPKDEMISNMEIETVMNQEGEAGETSRGL